MSSNETKNVLVVSQDQLTLQWLSAWLRDQGYNAIEATDADSVQGKIGHDTTLVICNIDSPLTDIDRLTHIAKSQASNVPLILVSGLALRRAEGSTVDSIRNGASDFSMKTISSLELPTKLTHALNERRLQEGMASLQGENAGGGAEEQAVKSLHALEKEAIINALNRFDGARGKTATVLGISVRTLQRKIKEYGYTNGGEKTASYTPVN